MGLGRSFRIWRRRWVLTIVLLILASCAAAAAASELRTYQSDSQVVLLASQSASRPNGSNPYLSFSPSLTLAADALSRAVMAPSVGQDLAARGLHGSYTVALAPYTTNTTGSVLLITVVGATKADAEGTLHALTAEISSELRALQRGVAPWNQIHAVTLSYSPQAALSLGSTARSVLPVVVLGVLVALGFPIIVDGWLTRRGRRLREAAVLADGVTDATDLAAGRMKPGDVRETLTTGLAVGDDWRSFP
jgi:branched-subunit amino acid transport protein